MVKMTLTFPLKWIVDVNHITGEFFGYALSLMGGDLPEYAILRK